MHLNFLYVAVSWVLLRWHSLFNHLGLSPDSGLNWALSIVFLVVTARLLLFRVFIKQVKYQRHMAVMQPKIAELRKKYKDDKQEMQRQMMKLQQEQGFNPLSGCLPMFLQIPIFLGLFHVLRHLSNSVGKCDRGSASSLLKIYTFSANQTCSAAQAKLFGAPLAARLTDGSALIHKLGGTVTPTRIAIVILVLISASATLATQLLVRRAATTVPEGSAATIQRLMLVVIPISTLGSGLFFPLGVLLYWFTSNTWTMLQQVYVNKFHPNTPPEVAEVGVLGKTLAPKPGQRPTRLTKTPADNVSDSSPGSAANGTAGGAGNGAAAADDAAPAPRVTPRPGQRPNRPGGNRPPAKRPSQAKKRR